MRSRHALALACLTLALSACFETDPPIPSDPDIDPNNQAPVAAPGPAQTVRLDALVTLDGSGSYDPDGDELTHQWELEVPAGSGAALAASSEPVTTFVADAPGEYTATLTVNDGQADSSATVRVTVLEDTSSNTPPVADAGVDRQVGVGQEVTLDGSGSRDADGDALTYQWALVSAPPSSEAMISQGSGVAASFVADVAGEYDVRLVVNDGVASSNPASVIITATEAPPENQPPVARVGQDQNAEVGDRVVLDGASSQDPDGDAISYQWSLDAPAGSAAALDDATASSPGFAADVVGSYVATLVVSDGELESAPATTRVTVSMGNQPPVARVGQDRSVAVGDVVTLDGSGSDDPDDDALTYQWSLNAPAGSGAALDDAGAAQPSFTVDAPGTYVATLTVTDGELSSAAVSTIITAVEPCLVISEYVEGSSYNKALELYNCSDGALALAGFGVCLFSNDAVGACSTTLTFGSEALARGDTLVVCYSRADDPTLVEACKNGTMAEFTSGVANFNGDDRLLLFRDTNANGAYDAGADAIVDAFGESDVRPASSIWNDVTYQRCTLDTFDGKSSFDVTRYFVEKPQDTFDDLGQPPQVAAGCP